MHNTSNLKHQTQIKIEFISSCLFLLIEGDATLLLH
jgi:hypothetical protein